MSTPYWSDEGVTLHLGDCLDVLRTLETDSIDAIVTDPPAGIAFMDREWDDFRRARNPADAGRDNVFGRTSARGPEYGRSDRRAFVDMLTARMTEACRVLKPGGHALVWSIPRTSHWTAWALEDAGFDVRDCVLHLFGSGFPKSHNVSVAIDKLKRRDYVLAAIDLGLNVPGNNLHDWTKAEHSPGDEWWGRFKAHLDPEDWQRLERAVVARAHRKNDRDATSIQLGRKADDYDITAPATEDAARWEGFGTALKPGQEMWWLARKPMKGTVAANVLEFGTGALNIAACKVAHASSADLATSQAKNPGRADKVTSGTYGADRPQQSVDDAGRWPSNVVFTHSAACEPAGLHEVRSDGHHPPSRGAGGLGTSGHAGQDGLAERKSGSEDVEAWSCAPDCPVGELDRQSGVSASRAGGLSTKALGVMNDDAWQARDMPRTGHADTGGASRFYPTFKYQAKAPTSERPRLDDGTAHETVKSLGLAKFLVRLVCPPGGTVLDLFCGSGAIGEACIIEGFQCILIDQDPKSVQLAKMRLSKPIQPTLFGGVA